MTETYSTGDVFDFPYLWAWQDQRGETEGRKDRPCCLALVSRLPSGKSRLFLIPITTVPPTADIASVLVPQIEAKRAGLDTHIKQWVILSEWNADVLEDSYYITHEAPKGRFSKTFLNSLLADLKVMLQTGKLQTIRRD